MKKLFGYLAIAATLAPVQSATADTITSAVVSDGAVETTLNTASDDPVYSGGSAVLQSFTAGGVNYDIVSGSDGYVGDVEGVVFPIGGTSPGASVALSDLDLSTGSLDPLGTGGPVASEYHDFRSQTISLDTVFFLFNNGTPPGSVVLVDNTGTVISNTLNRTALGPAEVLHNFAFSRTNGGNLNSRTVAGNIFAVNEFTLNAGVTVADIAGFRGSGSTFDAQDAGIAIAEVTEPPEPTGPVCFTGTDRFLMVGDSFINADDEWAALVRDTGVFGDVEIVATAGWPLVNNIRNAALSNYAPNDHEVVVVAGGVNDIADGRSAAEMQTATQAIVDDVRQGGGHIIILTVTPIRQVQNRVGGNASFFTEDREDIAEEYDAWARELADSANDVSLFDLRAILDPDGDGNADLDLIRGNPDLLHPDNVGSQVIADTFIEQFATFALGDVDRDNTVNFLDISPFIAVLSTGDYQKEADTNEDGAVDFLDIGPFITLLSQ